MTSCLSFGSSSRVVVHTHTHTHYNNTFSPPQRLHIYIHHRRYKNTGIIYILFSLKRYIYRETAKVDPSIISYQSAPGGDVVTNNGDDEQPIMPSKGERYTYSVDLLLHLANSPLVKTPEGLGEIDLSVL